MTDPADIDTIIAQAVQAERQRIADSLCRTPLIEEITPTPREWQACEVIGDCYDLMKLRVRMAFKLMGEA